MPKPDCVPGRDEALAREIAEFIAERAFEFWHHECRAWALSDFKAWAQIAGLDPILDLRKPVGAGGSRGAASQGNT